MTPSNPARPMRRLKNVAVGLALAAASVAPALAQPAPGPLVLTVHPLKGGVYWISGGVSNTGFVVGDKGVVVVDAQKTPQDAKAQLAEIAKVTSKPVNAILLSHSDPDHVGGLPAYPAGSRIFAQENAKAVILASMADPNGGPVYGPMYRALAGFLPTETIADKTSVVLDGVRMELIHTAPAHTSGDMIVYLPAQKLIFAGDLVTTNTGAFPVVHAGGTSVGWIAFMKAMLALDANTYVSGHGAMEGKAMLRARVAAAQTRREQVKAMVDRNKTLAEVIQALPDAPADPRFKTYTQTVYEELTLGYPPARAPWADLVKK